MMGGGVAGAAADDGLSPPIPVAHIQQAAYALVLDEHSQQLLKELFARLDAVRLAISLPERRSFGSHLRLSPARALNNAKVMGTLTDPRASRRMGTAC